MGREWDRCTLFFCCDSGHSCCAHDGRWVLCSTRAQAQAQALEVAGRPTRPYRSEDTGGAARRDQTTLLMALAATQWAHSAHLQQSRETQRSMLPTSVEETGAKEKDSNSRVHGFACSAPGSFSPAKPPCNTRRLAGMHHRHPLPLLYIVYIHLPPLSTPS